MAFNSPLFLFVFGPAVIAFHLWAPARWRMTIVLVASFVFYSWGEPLFSLLVVLLSGLDYVLCAAMVRASVPARRRTLLAVGVAANLGTLVYYKYVYLLCDGIRSLGLDACPVLSPGAAIPLGVSFVVFEKITYLVDTYRGTAHPASSFARYLSFVLLFPKLIAGPILKFHEMREQLERHTVLRGDIEAGLYRFLLGLFKKVVIADNVARLADLVFGAPVGTIGAGDAWIGALAFTVQIYFDFSGYSDMAIGLARMLGFRLTENFRQPYLATGLRDFWTRWHISLSTWIREYLYIPLGGGSGSRARTIAVLLTCFALSGLWHGAAVTFLLWGIYHGVLLAGERLWKTQVNRQLPRPLGVAFTFVLVVLGWVLFRANSGPQAASFYHAMIGDPLDVRLGYADRVDALLLLAAGLGVSFIPIRAAGDLSHRWLGRYNEVALRSLVLLATVLSLGQVFSVTYTPFIYFRF